MISLFSCSTQRSQMGTGLGGSLPVGQLFILLEGAIQDADREKLSLFILCAILPTYLARFTNWCNGGLIPVRQPLFLGTTDMVKADNWGKSKALLGSLLVPSYLMDMVLCPLIICVFIHRLVLLLKVCCISAWNCKGTNK